MQYLGGKFRVRKQIANYLNTHRKHEVYWEPFCGSCWVSIGIDAPVILLSDAHPELIALWTALRGGWVPPETISEYQYMVAKAGGYAPYLRGFIGFGCSFGGKWFGGYARSGKRNYASNARNSLLKKTKKLGRAHFFQMPYHEFDPDISVKMQIYCDPPYANTTQYDRFSQSFDSDLFWDTMRLWGDSGHDVYASEYNAPDDFESVLDIPTRTDMRNTAGEMDSRIERLFKIR